MLLESFYNIEYPVQQMNRPLKSELWFSHYSSRYVSCQIFTLYYLTSTVFCAENSNDLCAICAGLDNYECKIIYSSPSELLLGVQTLMSNRLIFLTFKYLLTTTFVRHTYFWHTFDRRVPLRIVVVVPAWIHMCKIIYITSLARYDNEFQKCADRIFSHGV